MMNPLSALLEGALQSNQFPPTSRYSGIGLATHPRVDGTGVVYLRRRFLPPGSAFTLLQEHTVTAGERVDLIAARYLGDSQQFWRICDANEVLQPEELVAELGRAIRITLPLGVTG